MSTTRQFNEQAYTSGNTRKTLAEGNHAAAIEFKEADCKYGQPRLVMKVTPLEVEGDLSTARPFLSTQVYINLPWIDDQAAFDAKTADKMAKEPAFAAKHEGKTVEQVSAERFAESEERAYQFTGEVMNLARVLFDIPESPTYDRATRSYIDADGNVFTGQEVEGIRKDIVRDALAQLDAVAKGETVLDGKYFGFVNVNKGFTKILPRLTGNASLATTLI